MDEEKIASTMKEVLKCVKNATSSLKLLEQGSSAHNEMNDAIARLSNHYDELSTLQATMSVAGLGSQAFLRTRGKTVFAQMFFECKLGVDKGIRRRGQRGGNAGQASRSGKGARSLQEQGCQDGRVGWGQEAP